MAWILNRAGQQHQEGPYEDGQLVHMIQTGGLREGFICRPGTQHWIALGEHPPFAQALASGGVPTGQPRRASGTVMMSAEPEAPPGASRAVQPDPAWSPEPPAARGYAPSPSPQAGTPMQQDNSVLGAAPGAPPPGWGGAAAALPPTASRRGAEPQKKKGIGLLLGILGGLVGVVVVGALLVLLLTGGGSRLSKFAPADVLVFVEFPSTLQAFKGALDVDFLNTSELDSERHFDDAVKALTETFELDKGKAEALLLSLDGAAFAMRKRAGKEQAAALLLLRNDDGIQAWLDSPRVLKEGKFGNSGERYFVDRMKTPPADDANSFTKGLAAMQVSKDSTSESLVWFPDANLLAMGEPDLLDDIDSVLSKGEGALADKDEFKRAEFHPDATVLGFVSAEVLDELKGAEQRKLVDGYLDGVEAFTMDSAFVDAGMLLRAQGQLKGKRITEEALLPAPVSLTLQERLPLDTVAYVALGSERTEDGKALKTQILKQLRATDEQAGQQLEQALTELEQGAGVGFEQIADAIGDQFVFGIVAERGFKFDKTKAPAEQLDQLAVLALTAVGKQDTAENVVKQARTRLFEGGPLAAAYDIKQQGVGFQGLPKDPAMPTVQVFFHEGNLLIGVGGKAVLAKALLAFGGKDALSADAAHQSAIKSLSGKPRALAWVDSGRVGRTALDALGEFEKAAFDEIEKQIGISHKAIQLEGDKRVTAALALFVDSEPEVWTYRIEALNAPALAVLSSLPDFTQASALPDPVAQVPSLPIDSGLFLPQTGVPQCDGLILVMFQCGERTQNAKLSQDARALEARFKTEFANASTRASAGSKCTQDLLQFMSTNPACTGN